MSEQETRSKTLTGSVVSSKMDKTIAVLVPRMVRHALYEKYIRRSTKVLAHDENNECREGDIVVIEPTRPQSKNKPWKLQRIITRAPEI